MATVPSWQALLGSHFCGRRITVFFPGKSTSYVQRELCKLPVSTLLSPGIQHRLQEGCGEGCSSSEPQGTRDQSDRQHHLLGVPVHHPWSLRVWQADLPYPAYLSGKCGLKKFLEKRSFSSAQPAGVKNVSSIHTASHRMWWLFGSKRKCWTRRSNMVHACCLTVVPLLAAMSDQLLYFLFTLGDLRSSDQHSPPRPSNPKVAQTMKLNGHTNN